MSWAAVFTDELLRQKRAGASFDRAWERALDMFPAGRRELGLRGVPAGTFEEERLVRERLDWYRERCRDAWEGRAPRLERLPQLVQALHETDHSSAVRRSGGYAAAA